VKTLDVEYFKVGGALDVSAASYVERSADRELKAAIASGEVVGELFYVLGGWQSGKTSLCLRTVQALSAAGYATVALDLAQLSSTEITREQWYAGIAYQLVRGLSLPVNLRRWLEDRTFLLPVQCLRELIEDVMLPQVAEPIVIVIDDLEAIRDLGFSADEFLGLVRHYAVNHLLGFVVFSAAYSRELVREVRNLGTLSLEMGRDLTLTPIELGEAQALMMGLRSQFGDQATAVLEAILEWTGGQPFLTQKVCQAIWQQSLTEAAWPPTAAPPIWVAHFIQSQFVTNWEKTDRPLHLRSIRDHLLHHEQALAILQLYQQVLQQGAIWAENHPHHTALRLSGLVIERDRALQVSNRIYSRVFDWRWLRQALAQVQPDLVQVVTRQEQRLLELLKHMDGMHFDEVLREILGPIAFKLAETIQADRVTLFLIDEPKNEIWSIVARNHGIGMPDVKISGNLEGVVAALRDQVNTPFYFNDITPNSLERSFSGEAATPPTFNPASTLGKPGKFGISKPGKSRPAAPTRQTPSPSASLFVPLVPLSTPPQTSPPTLGQYRSYTLLVLPLMNDLGHLVAVVQLVNKLRHPNDPSAPLIDRIDPNGFSISDETHFYDYAVALIRLIDRLQSSYNLTQRLKASEALTEATRSLSQSSLDADQIVTRVMAAAKKLMHADRTTLWILDDSKQRLWTKIPREDGTVLELTLAVGEGYAGQVAQTGKTISIPFDLYNFPGSEIAKRTDRQTGYRTCSLLCMPVRNLDGELIAVTQLINRRRPGEFAAYDPAQWPEAPECFRASFDSQSEKYMQIFNDQVGVALQNAQQYAEAKRRANLHPSSVVNQTLAMLDQVMDSQGFDQVLDTTLRSITIQVGRSLNADRTSIFMLDEERQEFWTILAESDAEQSLEIRIPADRGIVGEVAATKRTIIIPFDFYDDPRSDTAQEQDRRNKYRTATMLAIPLLDQNNDLVAVVQLINKIRPGVPAHLPLLDRLDPQGFTLADQDRFAQSAETIRLILESFRTYHRTSRGQRVAAALMAATRSVTQDQTHFDAILEQIMQAAKTLMNADRSTLWLIDYQREQLWTKVRFADGSWRELRVPIGAGYVGQVAQTQIPLSIPFDLYRDPGSEMAQRTDRQTGYRTCSLLCMPVFSPDGDLLGVTQLVNKIKPGSLKQLLSYDLAVPPCFQTGFTDSDQRYMEIFNNQAGTVLQNSALIDAVKRQEQSLRDTISPNFSATDSDFT